MSENRTPQPELHVGEVIDVPIQREGSKGVSVGFYQGFSIHVPNANPGETVKVKITKVHGTKANAIILGDKKKGNLF